jgi:hypothetical protein
LGILFPGFRPVRPGGGRPADQLPESVQEKQQRAMAINLKPFASGTGFIILIWLSADWEYDPGKLLYFLNRGSRVITNPKKIMSFV